MDHELIERLQAHPAWKLLRAGNATLVLSFLGRFFVGDHHGATPAAPLAAELERELDAVATTTGEEAPPRYPRSALEYLDEWARAGWLRRFYPLGTDEVHYDATPALERAFTWVEALQSRSFVGTESRLNTVIELLRQMVEGAEPDAEARLEKLRRRRTELDREIAAAEKGHVQVLDGTGLRDRYQQFSATARELLADFREVEDNFRSLDRGARERIAGWQGSKGELLTDLVSSRADITSSDQGRSFHAFYDLLLSEARQDELAELLRRVRRLEDLTPDPRLATVHHDWADAAERTQRTVRQISEQLRRFLDDRVWLENRRVVELIRDVEAAALALRDTPPPVGLEVDAVGVDIALPFERPLFDARPAARVDSLLDPDSDAEVDVDALFTQTFVDQARLANIVREAVPRHGSALLGDILSAHPVRQGAAEIVGYLALGDEEIDLSLDDTEETLVEYRSSDDAGRRARLAKVTVNRR